MSFLDRLLSAQKNRKDIRSETENTTNISDNGVCISVLGASRKRPNLLEKNLQIMMDLCENIDLVEILLRIDDDDVETINLCKTSPFFKKYNVKIFVGARFGYKYLWKYYEYLTLMAKGKIFVPFADDCVHITKRWDTELAKYKNEKVVIGSKLSIAITRKIFEEEKYLQNWTGKVTWDTGIEGWAKSKNKLQHIDKWYRHDRALDIINEEGRGGKWKIEDLNILNQIPIELVIDKTIPTTK